MKHRPDYGPDAPGVLRTLFLLEHPSSSSMTILSMRLRMVFRAHGRRLLHLGVRMFLLGTHWFLMLRLGTHRLRTLLWLWTHLFRALLLRPHFLPRLRSRLRTGLLLGRSCLLRMDFRPRLGLWAVYRRLRTVHLFRPLLHWLRVRLYLSCLRMDSRPYQVRTALLLRMDLADGRRLR